MGDLAALFSDMGGFKDDLMAYGMMSVGAIGGIAAYNFLFNEAVKLAKIDTAATTGFGSYVKYLKPAGAVVLGIFAGTYVSRKFNRNVGQGLAVGLSAAGFLGLLNAIPATRDLLAKLPGSGQMQLAGLRGYGGMRGLRGAPIQIEQVSGAPISVQAMQGLGRMNVGPTLY